MVRKISRVEPVALLLRERDDVPSRVNKELIEIRKEATGLIHNKDNFNGDSHPHRVNVQI